MDSQKEMEYNAMADKFAHPTSGKGRSKKESEMNTNRPDPCGDSRKLVEKFKNTEKNHLKEQNSSTSTSSSTKQPIAGSDGSNSTFYYEASTFLQTANKNKNSSRQESKDALDAASPFMTSGRQGRMLDLDALVGEFAASQAKRERERNMSGNRQSRYLSSGQNQPTLNVGNGKKLHIQGFIPIVGVKDVTGQEHEEVANDHQASGGGGAAAELSYGQSSIGHASFMSNSPSVQRYLNGDQQAAPSQQVDAKFSGATVVETIKKPIKKLTGFGSDPSSQQQQQNCLCVPFYMCKNGYLSESSLGKTQLQQMIAQQQQLASQTQVLEMNSGPLLATNQKPINEPQQKEAQYDDSYVPVDERSVEREIITMSPLMGGNFDANGELSTNLTLNTQQSSGGGYTTSNADLQASNNSNPSLESASDYSQDILGRMLGLKSGITKASLTPSTNTAGGVCGLLRTCCNIPMHLYPSQQDVANERLMAQTISLNSNNQQVQRYQANKQALQPVSPQLEQALQQPQVIVGQRYGPIQQLPYGQPTTNQISLPTSQQQLGLMAHRSNQFQSINTNRYSQQHQQLGQFPPTQPQPFMRGTPVQMQPLQSFQQLQSFYQQPQVKAQPIPTAAMMAAAAAAASLSGSQLASSNQVARALPTGTRKILDGRCGLRQAAGITGRVQNLHYPDSSADFGEYPAQAAILKRLGGSDSLFVCGGTLISQYWVATAAHCIKKQAQSELKIRLGEWDVHRDDEFYPFVEKEVRDLVIHPEFVAGNLINDIALLRLDSPVDSSLPHVSPACLPQIDESFSRQRCWVTGWGKDSFGQRGSFQAVLREVELPVVGQGECESALRQTRLGSHYRLHSGFICAGGEGGRDACEGDGGSGLYCIQPDGLIKVAGLVSWGIGCGQPGVPGVYVNLAHYRPWIENIISIDEDIYSPYQSMLSGANSLVSERSKGANETTPSQSGEQSIPSTPPPTITSTSTTLTTTPSLEE